MVLIFLFASPILFLLWTSENHRKILLKKNEEIAALQNENQTLRQQLGAGPLRREG